MKAYLDKIRKPIDISFSEKLFYSSFVFISGVLLGVVSKVLDETPSNLLPFFMETLDLRNFFSRIGVWIFLAVVISVYSKSPLRAALNVFLFFVGMIGSYYLYTVFVAGFFPKSYMMLWIAITMLSPLLAFICWYAKGTKAISISIAAIIVLFISRQTFAFGFWYFDITYSLEFLLWVLTIIILYKSRKQIIKVVFIGIALFFLTAQMQLFGGLL